MSSCNITLPSQVLAIIVIPKQLQRNKKVNLSYRQIFPVRSIQWYNPKLDPTTQNMLVELFARL